MIEVRLNEYVAGILAVVLSSLFLYVLVKTIMLMYSTVHNIYFKYKERQLLKRLRKARSDITTVTSHCKQCNCHTHKALPMAPENMTSTLSQIKTMTQDLGQNNPGFDEDRASSLDLQEQEIIEYPSLGKRSTASTDTRASYVFRKFMISNRTRTAGVCFYGPNGTLRSVRVEPDIDEVSNETSDRAEKIV